MLQFLARWIANVEPEARGEAASPGTSGGVLLASIRAEPE